MDMSPSDDNTYPSSASKKTTYALLAIKFLELCLLISVIGLIDEPAAVSTVRGFMTPVSVALCYVTFGALLIYTTIYLIMAMFGDSTPWRTAAVWAFVGLALTIACTAVLFRDWNRTKLLNNWHPNMNLLDLVLSAACVSLVSNLIYLIDVLVIVRFGVRGDLE